MNIQAPVRRSSCYRTDLPALLPSLEVWLRGSMQVIRQNHNMNILGIDHIQLAIPAGEEDKARGFYVNLLGFREIPKPIELAKRGGAWFDAGTVQLHLGVEADFRPARKAHPAFLVDDLDGLIAKVRSAGFEIDSTQPPLSGYKRVHVFDPFGNRIELMEKVE